jgi:glycosyltransferase involved in cell wall biosynthesis
MTGKKPWYIPQSVDTTLYDPARYDVQQQKQQRGFEGYTVAGYVGTLTDGGIRDIESILQAVTLAQRKNDKLLLLIVGGGPRHEECERLLKAHGVRHYLITGIVDHSEVPGYIACADLCLAPYDPAFFPRGKVGYATLKVREYLASGRPVATSRTGVLPGLIRPGVTGFLLENDADTWVRFLREELPARPVLLGMGIAAAKTPLESWEDTARAYWSVCERALARTGEPAAV